MVWGLVVLAGFAAAGRLPAIFFFTNLLDL